MVFPQCGKRLLSRTVPLGERPGGRRLVCSQLRNRSRMVHTLAGAPQWNGGQEAATLVDHFCTRFSGWRRREGMSVLNCRTGCRSRDIPAGTTSEIQRAIAATRRRSGRLH